MPLDEYFLSSVMLLNRQTHEPMLRLALSIYPEIESRVFEQTAVNAARRRLGIPIRFMDRRYNWSLFGEGNLHEQSGCIIAHFNSDNLRHNPGVVAKSIPHVKGTIDPSGFTALGNRYYRYVRVGFDERPLFLCSDGTIGQGGGDAERFWYVRRTDGGPVLVIGAETTTTCELISGDSEEWHGSWLAYERMPVILTPHHGQVLLDLIPDRGRSLRGAEIGVFRGHTSALFLRALPQLTLWMVDTWRAPQPGERVWEDPHWQKIGADQIETALNASVTSTEFARGRRIMLVSDLVTAADSVPDASLDFVFLDADHSREGTLEVMQAWCRKVVPGGLVAGHDLDYPDYPGVRQAVEGFCSDHQVTWHVAPDYVWWFKKPQEQVESFEAAVQNLQFDGLSQDRSTARYRDLALVQPRLLNNLGDRYYRYLRVDHDERPLYFMSCGTVGFGGGGAERFWSCKQTSDGPVLTIRSDSSDTCILHPTSTDLWEGNWLDYERMPILITPHRGQVLLELLGDPSRPYRGAEIGIFEGHTSAVLLNALPELNLLMVDAWHSPSASDSLWDDPYMRQVSSAQMLTALHSAISRTEFDRDRRTIVVADLVVAAQSVPNETLDFVFLDADHSKAGTLEALRTWSPKVVPGGIVSGHDLDHPDFPEVRTAVEEFTRERQLEWHVGPDFVWWFRALSSDSSQRHLPAPCERNVELAASD